MTKAPSLSNSPTPFQAYLLRWYARHGRRELPWRQTTNPYRILVSEVMLQQTQVERVIPKYLAFLEKFPTVEALAAASQADVLKLWQGLGYNRRARYLHQAAQVVVTDHGGTFPESREELQELPGVGPYTSGAVCVFAYNQPVALIETNVRTVFLYHFFPGEEAVSDKALHPLVERELWQANPREWYAALMDYGTVLKKLLPNPSRRSKHHTKQSTFAGSLRQVRGEIIRLLTQHPSLTTDDVRRKIAGDLQHFAPALEQLKEEGFITTTNGQLSLAEE